MPTTPLRSWVYPAYETNPYFDEIVTFFEAQDADVQTLFTARPWTGVLIANSAALTNPTTAFPGDAFNKSITIPAGSLNVVGASIGVQAAGIYTSGATASIAIGFVCRVGSITIGFAQQDTPVSQTDTGWNLQASAVIRSLGASGVIRPGFGSGGLHPSAMAAGWGDDAGAYTLNTAASQAVQIYVGLEAAMTPALTITLSTMMVHVMYPTVTVS